MASPQDVAQTVDVDAVEESSAVGPTAQEHSREETRLPAPLRGPCTTPDRTDRAHYPIPMVNEDTGAAQTGPPALDGVSPPPELVENAVAVAREDSLIQDHATHWHPHRHNLLALLRPTLPIFHGADTIKNGTGPSPLGAAQSLLVLPGIEYILDVPLGQSNLGELIYLIHAGGASFHSNVVGDPALLSRSEVQAQLATAFAEFLFDPNPHA
uniref:Uncharacterized protein n=1 Tax=Mycena chlorophos TaxID=658473 RepID=A0ABQ0LIU8_MYCCL|nr:predicted protein [Mycena chlorophos]